MTLFRNTVILSLCLVVMACSSLAFNERYSNVRWNSIVVSPVSGDFSTELTNILEHNLTSNENMVVYSPKYVEENFGEVGKDFDIKKLKVIANSLGVDGILLTESSHSDIKAYQSNSGLGSSRAVVFYRLIDAKSGLTVATSKKEDSSIFSDTVTVLENAAISALKDIKKALNELSD